MNINIHCCRHSEIYSMANSNQYFSQGQGLAEQDKVAGITKILLIQVFTRYENASESQVEVGLSSILQCNAGLSRA